MAFKFKLKQPVVIAISGEEGIVIGRAEYSASKPQYFIHFKAADGRACTAWYEADFLAPVDTE